MTNLICRLWRHDDPLEAQYLMAIGIISEQLYDYRIADLNATPRKCLRCGEELGR